MVRTINPLLTTPIIDFLHVDRLEFREDLPRGSKKIIYQAIADLLHCAGKGRSVMARGYSQDDLFWWFTLGGHSNLGAKFETLKRKVYQ